MTIQELNTQLDKALRAYIKQRDHILTGALYRSVMFDCDQQEEGVQIRFSAKYYIKFLEHGVFVKDFFALPTTQAILNSYASEYIDKIIAEELQ